MKTDTTGQQSITRRHFPLQNSALLVSLLSQQGTNHHLSWKFSTTAQTVWRNFHLHSPLADILHLCLILTHCPPPRNDNGLCVLSRVLGICEGGVVGFHFPSATLYEAKEGTNEHCFSVCSCSGAHKLTLFIDPALHCAPIYRKLFPFSSFSPKQMMLERL